MKNNRFWLIEYTNTNRFETVLKANNVQDAIVESLAIYNDLSEHDKSRRYSVEIIKADIYTDEDTPKNIIYPDEKTEQVIYIIK